MISLANLVLLGFFMLFSYFSVGGDTSPTKENISFHQVKEGLSQSSVTSILQDYHGYLWIGTRNGLNRYDGVEFKVYEHNFSDSSSISDSHVQCIFEDSKKNLWIGTLEGGLNLLDRTTDKFTNFKHDPENGASLSDNTVNAIFEDSRGNLWIGTNWGLNLFNPHTQTFQHYLHDSQNPNSLTHNQVMTILEDDQGKLWLGTWAGVDSFDSDTKNFTHYRTGGINASPSSNQVRSAYKSESGEIWFGTSKGLYLLYRDYAGNIKFKSYLNNRHNPKSMSHDIVLSINEDSQGNLWVGLENGGLNILNRQRQEFLRFSHNPNDKNSIASNIVWYIYRDRVGTMWIGTFDGGLNKYDPYEQKFINYYQNPISKNTLPNNSVHCFLEEGNGDIWIGTDGGGMAYFDRSNHTYEHIVKEPNNPNSLSSNKVMSMLEDSYGNFWVGTWEGGLNLFDKKTKTFERVHVDNDSNDDNIFYIYEDSKRRIWMANIRNGLELYLPEKNEFIRFSHDPNDEYSISSNHIYTIFEDNHHNIWIGTQEGLSKLVEIGDKFKFVRFLHDPNDRSTITSNVILSIFQDSRGNLWLGTQGGGLNYFNYDTEIFTSLGKVNGLPNEVINAILEDNFGNIWLSTNKGLSKFDLKSKTFKNFDANDGLQASEFIRGSRLKTKRGELLFGGINGFNMFDPSKILDNPNPPNIVLTDFKLFNSTINAGEGSPLKKHINYCEEIQLNYDESLFTFEFAALNFSQSNKNQYAYILEGYDENWQFIGTRRSANFTKVPPGHYTFKVRGTNNDGVWNRQIASVDVIIKPPWYKTIWAYAAYLFLIGVLLYWGRKDIIQRERLKSNLKLEQLELAKMQEMDQVKSRFFANISHEFRTPLTLILGPLRAMYSGQFMGDKQRHYKMMMRNAQKMLRLVNQLMDLSKIGAGSMRLKAERADIVHFIKPLIGSFESYAERQHINFSSYLPKSPINVYFDQDKLEKIITNILSNAFKFTPEYGDVIISAKELPPDDDNVPGYVEIRIKDTGIGIPKNQLDSIFEYFYQVGDQLTFEQKGTGIGLALTKELVDLHKGKLSVDSAINKGTVFTIVLPLGNDHLDEGNIVNPGEEISEVSFEDLDISSQQAFKENVDKSNDTSPLPVILIADDNQDIREYISEHLNTYYRIVETANGEEAYEKALEFIPDLIVSDIMMPNSTGYELCKNIKSNPKTSHIPIILLTAKAGSHNKIEGYLAGADYYITKPFNSKLLELQIKNILDSNKRLKEQICKPRILNLEPKQVNLKTPEETFLKEALESIESNMSNSEFSVEDFGRDLGLSRMQLYRKLKALTGQSPNEFIRYIRLKRAAQLIKQKHLTIAEVTYDVGFNDLKYFRDCFKKQFGVNPSDYASQTTS